jgi:hypothetical protein
LTIFEYFLTSLLRDFSLYYNTAAGDDIFLLSLSFLFFLDGPSIFHTSYCTRVQKQITRTIIIFAYQLLHSAKFVVIMEKPTIDGWRPKHELRSLSDKQRVHCHLEALKPAPSPVAAARVSQKA